jgi:2-keto-4-pentenoate hydratase/2-oxohepta-3-ene-1,7-dioic acid hydratase in catechol pathway
MKGKCAETFGPLGPWLTTREEIEDVQNLAMSLDVNGQRRQTGNTKTMIFGIAHCLHYITQFMVLEPGDVVTTGTPPGVALGMKPPVWLKAGDEMTLAIQGLGAQKQKVAAFKE